MPERGGEVIYAYTDRQLGRDVYNGLKTAFRALVRLCGKQDSAASLTRVDQTTISRYGTPGIASDGREHWSTIDVVTDLETAVGEPVVTRHMAKLQGYLLVKEPAAVRSGEPLGLISAAAMKEVSDIFSRFGTYLSTGVMTDVGGKPLSIEIDEAVEKLLTLKLQDAEHRKRRGQE